jgi:hypothetical protein
MDRLLFGDSEAFEQILNQLDGRLLVFRSLKAIILNFFPPLLLQLLVKL